MLAYSERVSMSPGMEKLLEQHNKEDGSKGGGGSTANLSVDVSGMYGVLFR